MLLEMEDAMMGALAKNISTTPNLPRYFDKKG